MGISEREFRWHHLDDAWRAPFDVADLLVRWATVYLLGGEETQAAPVVCALTGHIAREARR